MRKLYVLLSLFVIASFVLAACGTATPAAAPSGGEEEAAAEEPMAEEDMMEGPACADNPYVGSAALDGNGIPCDFFADEHVRKAFAYAFDYQTYIDEVFLGEGVQPVSLVLPGMAGYHADTPHYSYDLEMSAAEFQQADLDHDGIPAGEDPEGDVWTTGFRLQMLYNLGNTSRQNVAEIMAAGLSEVNELFSVEILGLPWPSYLTAQRASQIPIMTAGWLEDIHDPHNWYQPYTVGAYGARSNLPEDLTAQFRELLEAGVSAAAPDRDAIYVQMNQLYYDSAPGMPTVNATGHAFEQRWVSGRILNPIYPGINYSTISKSGSNDDTTFVWDTIGDADTFDPALAYDTASGDIIQNTYETLVFYDGEATDVFVPKLADTYEVSEDGATYTFHVREGVSFHNGATLDPEDVAYSFQRGILQGSYISPQWLIAEPIFGAGLDDVCVVVSDDYSTCDDREAMQAADADTLVAACEQVKAAVVADEAAGTVTFNLAGPWGPFLATIAQSWGSILDKDWAIENGAWDGDCATWQNYYAATSEDDPLSAIVNGTGPFMLDHWTKGEEIVLARFDGYWGELPALERVVIKGIDEWGTRFAEFQAGDADIVTVNRSDSPQVDPLAGEWCTWNADADSYDCEVVGDGPFRARVGRPGLTQDVIIFNFDIH